MPTITTSCKLENYKHIDSDSVWKCKGFLLSASPLMMCHSRYAGVFVYRIERSETGALHRPELESFSRPQPCSTPRLQAELVVTEPQTRHPVLAMEVCFSNVPFQNSLAGA